MAFCQHCKAQLEEDARFCTYCGIQVKQEEIVEEIPVEIATKLEENQTKEEKIFFDKLVMGEYGLAKTFWLYGFLVRVLANGILRFISDKSIFIVCILLYLLYEFFVMIGTWHAANRYMGLKLWPALAKLIVIFGIFAMLITLPTIAELFKTSTKEKQSEKVVPVVEKKPIEENNALIQMQKDYIADYNTTIIKYEYDKQKCKVFDIKILLQSSNYTLEDIYIGYTINNKQWWFKNTPLTFPQSIYVGCESIEDVSKIKEIKTKKNVDVKESSVDKNDKTNTLQVTN